YVERLKATRWRPEYFDENEAKAILAKKPVLEFNHDLPPTNDYKQRTEIIVAPANLKPGFYYLIVSHAENFGSSNNSVNYSDFWVSDRAIVQRSDLGNPQAGGMVLDNRTGEPVADAKVQVWTQGNNGGWNQGESGTSDKNGLFAVAAEANRSHVVLVTSKE